MKIPMGNFGNQVAEPGPAAQYSPAAAGAQVGAAVTQLGDAGSAVAATQHAFDVQQQDALARTSALTAYQTHQTSVKIAMQDAGEALTTNQIDPAEYQKRIADATQQSYDATIGALPDSQFKEVAARQNVALNRVAQLQMNSTLTKYTQQQNAANVGALLDNAGKDITVDPANIANTTASTKAAFFATAPTAGIGAAKAQEMYTNWENQQYSQHATLAAMQARGSGDLAGLNQLQHDLTAQDGFYAGKMSGAQRNQVLSTVISSKLTLENQLTAEQQARENQAVTAYNQALDLSNNGKLFSPEYQKQLTVATAGTSLEKDTQSLIAGAAKNAGFASLPLSKMREAIQNDQSAASTPGVGTDPATAALVKQRQQMYTAANEAYQKDPWNAALDRGAITQIPQIDTSSIQGLTSSLTQRVALAGVVDNAAGRRVSLLTPDEASTVLKTVNALPLDARAQVLTNLGGVFGDAGRIADLAQQWKEKDPAAALALKAGAGGGNGNPLKTVTGQPVGAFILSGQQAIRDKTVKVDDTVGTGMRGTIANAIDGAMPPEQADDAKESAYLIAIGSAARNGRAAPNSSDIQDGINAATGGISTTGGTRYNGNPNKVAMPYGWKEDDFQASVKAAGVGNIENTINGKPIDTVYANGNAIPAADFMAKFPSYQLVRVGVRGTYAVATGSKFVTDAGGKPVTVHLTLGGQHAN
jgi:hypothetical protein